MPSFHHDGVEIAFLEQGEGEPIVLVHGFASNAAVNWVHPGWVATLTKAGRRAIALDNRGHGASAKLYDPAAYHSAVMADDVRALAACIRGSRQTLSPAEVAAIRVPTLVAVGTKDFVAGSASELAALIPGAQALDIPGRDHMLAVGDKVFKAGVLQFLAERRSSGAGVTH